jgi:outer membrane protein OmpA-like peptidoglycan-associated protein
LRKLLLISSVVAFSVSGVYAAGTTAADFLNIAPGARPAGLGEAFVAVADETSGMYYNPAGLAYSLSPELQTMYSMWLADLYYGYVGYSHPTNSGTFGLGVQYLSGPAIDRITNGVKQQTFSYSDMALTVPYSLKLSQGSALGVNLKSVSSQIDSSNAAAFTGDLGYMYKTPEEGFSFGVAGQNLFGQMGDDKLPAAVRGGVAFKASLPEHNSDILFSLEAGKAGSDPAYYSAGLEHWGAGTLGLRFGYKFYADQKTRDALDPMAPWRAGLSLRFNTIAFDYAYQPFAAMNITHRISLTWRTYGWLKRWKIVPCTVKADPTLFSPNNDARKDSVFFVPSVTDIKDVKDWSLEIMDMSKNPVKKFTGKDVLPKILSWEGQTETGGQVQEGKYIFRFTAEGDGRKRAVSQDEELIADMTQPTVLLQVSTDTFSPGADGLSENATFYVSVTDAYGIDQWELKVLNDKGKPVKLFKSSSSDPVEVEWNGKDDYYGTIVPNGLYEARLTAWDLAGNRTVSTATVTVFVKPKEIVKEVVKEVNAKETSRGLVVNLSSQVLFGTGKAQLKSIAFKSLDEVVNLLQTYSENKVVIEGHTDGTGSRSKNLELSGARGWAVYSYLVKHGIEPSRLSVTGLGPDKPVATNRTAAGRSSNRRVEIIILKNTPKE